MMTSHGSNEHTAFSSEAERARELESSKQLEDDGVDAESEDGEDDLD
jgi:hypothetical protein